MKNLFIFHNWYPTIDDPLNGVFFEERARLLTQITQIRTIHIQRVQVSFFSLKWVKSFVNSNSVVTRESSNLLHYHCKVFLIDLDSRIFRFTLTPFLKQKLIKLNYFLLAKSYENAYLKFENRRNDVLYGTSVQSCGSAILSLSEKYNLNYILSEHSIIHRDVFASYRTSEAMLRASFIIAISHDKLRDLLKLNYNFRYRFLPNMVDEDKFMMTSHSRSGMKVLLFVGSSSWRKDLKTFIKVLASLEAEKVFGIVRIIGIPYNVFTSLMASINISFDFKFLKIEILGVVDRLNLPGNYSQADALLITSVYEGIPNVCLEAMSCGLPVFSTKCGGVEDIIDGNNGFLFNIGDSDEISKYLISFFSGKLIFDGVYIRKKVIDYSGKHKYLSFFSDILKE